MSTNPSITSTVNGLRIFLPKSAAGIMHRFGNNQDNKRIIKNIDEAGSRAVEPEMLTIPGTPEPGPSL